MHFRAFDLIPEVDITPKEASFQKGVMLKPKIMIGSTGFRALAALVGEVGQLTNLQVRLEQEPCMRAT